MKILLNNYYICILKLIQSLFNICLNTLKLAYNKKWIFRRFA